MKKAVSLMMAAAMTMGLAACGATASTDTAAPAADATSTADTASGTEAAADSKVYRVGICQLVQHEALDAATQGFKDALVEALGEGNVKFDEQNASGDSANCATIVNGFVSSNVDLILANATAPLQAAAQATADIPVLGTSVTDYATALDISDTSQLSFTYQGRVDVLLGNSSSLDYKLRLAAKILTDPDKGLSGSDRGTLDVSDQLEDGEIRGYFQPYEQPTPTPEPAPEPDPESENAENAEEPPPE